MEYSYHTPKNERKSSEKGPFQEEMSSFNHQFSGDKNVSFQGSINSFT